MSTNTPLHAKAQGWAITELVDRHREEYQELYAFYKKELGIVDLSPGRSGRSNRPPAPKKRVAASR